MRIMKHTSINLSEEHLALIKNTDRSPTTIIREALDRYFHPEPSAKELIAEHERLYHGNRLDIGMQTGKLVKGYEIEKQHDNDEQHKMIKYRIVNSKPNSAHKMTPIRIMRKNDHNSSIGIHSTILEE